MSATVDVETMREAADVITAHAPASLHHCACGWHGQQTGLIHAEHLADELAKAGLVLVTVDTTDEPEPETRTPEQLGYVITALRNCLTNLAQEVQDVVGDERQVDAADLVYDAGVNLASAARICTEYAAVTT